MKLFHIKIVLPDYLKKKHTHINTQTRTLTESTKKT